VPAPPATSPRPRRAHPNRSAPATARSFISRSSPAVWSGRSAAPFSRGRFPGTGRGGRGRPSRSTWPGRSCSATSSRGCRSGCRPRPTGGRCWERDSVALTTFSTLQIEVIKLVHHQAGVDSSLARSQRARTRLAGTSISRAATSTSSASWSPHPRSPTGLHAASHRRMETSVTSGNSSRLATASSSPSNGTGASTQVAELTFTHECSSCFRTGFTGRTRSCWSIFLLVAAELPPGAAEGDLDKQFDLAGDPWRPDLPELVDVLDALGETIGAVAPAVLEPIVHRSWRERSGSELLLVGPNYHVRGKPRTSVESLRLPDFPRFVTGSDRAELMIQTPPNVSAYDRRGPA
jgi:hypothetical protein